MPYRGPQMKTLAMHKGMLAHDNVTQKRYLLAVEVPGMLENRPVVVFGSRVHVTYKVGLVFCTSAVPMQALRMICELPLVVFLPSCVGATRLDHISAVEFEWIAEQGHLRIDCIPMQGSVAEDVCVVLDMYQTWCILSAPGWLLEAAHGAFAQSCIPNQSGDSLNLQQAIFRCAARMCVCW